MIQAKSRDTCLISNGALHKMLQTVVQLLGLLHEVPSRLFRRGQHQLQDKCCYREINSVQELYDHTTCGIEKVMSLCLPWTILTIYVAGNITISSKETGCNVKPWTQLTQDRVKTVMHLWVPRKKDFSWSNYWTLMYQVRLCTMKGNHNGYWDLDST
jgi:hypothetical protein